MDTGWAILLSAGIASVGWYVTNRNQQVMSRRQHTYRVFEDYRTEEVYTDCVKTTYRLAPDNIPNPADDKRITDIEKIIYVLNHYEFIAAAIFNGDVDEGFFKSCEYTTIVRLPLWYEKFIKERIKIRKQKTAYKNLIDLSSRWLDTRQKTTMNRIYEFFMMRPYRKLPNKMKKTDVILASWKKPSRWFKKG